MQVPLLNKAPEVCSNDQSFNSWSLNIEKNMYKLLGRKAAGEGGVETKLPTPLDETK